MSSFKSDGDFRDANQTGADVPHRPFLNLGNSANVLIERFYLQDLPDYELLDLHTPSQDAEGNTIYLIDETPLDPGQTGAGMAAYSRFYAPLWSEVVEYGEYVIQLPDFRGLSYDPGGGAVTATYDESTRSIQLDGLPATTIDSVGSDFTAGDWTYLGSASIDWDDSEATILSALQAVDANFISVTRSSTGMLEVKHSGVLPTTDISANFDLSNLTDVGAMERVAGAYTGSGYAHTYYIYPEHFEVNKTAHGLSEGAKVFLRASGSGYSTQRDVVEVDVNTFKVLNDRALMAFTIDEYSAHGFYHVRAKTVRCQRVHQFFMPSVTPGIATVEDIPAVAVMDYDYALFRAMVDGDEEIVIKATGLAHPYPGLYSRVITKIKTADLYD